MKCLFCNNDIPLNRRHNGWLKYCSNICNKRSWYIRHNQRIKSYFSKNPDFWKTETGIGFKWEKWSAKLLGAKHLEFNYNGADLNWNGKFIDVKVSNVYKRKFKRGVPVKSEQTGIWLFNKNKEKPLDYFFCICLIKNKLYKSLLIPSSEFKNKHLCIGRNSKYDKYKLL